ncbi:oligosaccharide flippase family protein (plasmid) [Cereibacter azotoformans]|uniref:oligosaccharide flippase family protein n=1 Tax=Cereibacter azotoformans TaxID=43057 RepID=UPI000E36049F|nr:oligosaccharide flippase family protein [Cereibacter azotoformans]AXQ95942.1 hypothetical protein D0Z66_19475 [Cereibacter sphaeroides]UIJ33012.1 oligosaccharide flippase family protein [Cereibacter azotoformans]
MTAVVRWLAVLLPFSALGTIHAARLACDFRQKSLALQSMPRALLGQRRHRRGLGRLGHLSAGGAVGRFLGGDGLAHLEEPALAAGLWLPLVRLRGILRFSASMVTTQLLWMLLVRVQDLFLARWHGAEAVGTYRVAWRLIELIGQSVLAPALSIVICARNRDHRLMLAALAAIRSGGLGRCW